MIMEKSTSSGVSQIVNVTRSQLSRILNDFDISKQYKLHITLLSELHGAQLKNCTMSCRKLMSLNEYI